MSTSFSSRNINFTGNLGGVVGGRQNVNMFNSSARDHITYTTYQTSSDPPPAYPIPRYFFNDCSIHDLRVQNIAGAEWYFTRCDIHTISGASQGDTLDSTSTTQYICFTFPALDNNRPSSSYYFYPAHRLITDNPLSSLPSSLPLDDLDDNDFVEFYVLNQGIYQIHHKERSYKLLEVGYSSDSDLKNTEGQDIVLPTITPYMSGTHGDYWKYVENHPALHSLAARELILDCRNEAVQLLRRYSPGKRPEQFDAAQVGRRLAKPDINRPDADAKVVRMIAMVLGGVDGNSGSEEIAEDDIHWLSVQHPDGWLYFFHPIYHVVVDAAQEPFKPPLPLDDSEEIYKDGSKFYKISHTHRSLSDIRQSTDTVRQDQYWAHIAKFPSHYPIYVRKSLLRAREEALLYLRWCSFQALMPSSSPTAPFTLKLSQDLHEILSKINEIPSLDPAQDGPAIMMIAKVLAKKYEFEDGYKFGQVDAIEFKKQGQPDSSERNKTPGNLVLMFIMTTFFFTTPFRYLRYISSLDTMFLRGEHWRLHIQRLVKEWTDSNLLATVLLSATVAFLAIPDLTVVCRTSVLVSILSSLGSLVAGLFCVSKYQSHSPEADAFGSPSIQDAQYYKRNLIDHHYHRRVAYAIILSLPIVLLLWSMISFAIAIIAFNFSGTNTNPIPSGSWEAVVSIWAIMLGLIAFVVFGVEYVWRAPHGRFALPDLVPRARFTIA